MTFERASRGELLALVAKTGTLCLNVTNPGWENARGYFFDPGTTTLYFPVAKKCLDSADLSKYEVLIWSNPRVVVRGELRPATSQEDADLQLALAERGGLDPGKARFMVLDQRSQKARRTRHKLIVKDLALLERGALDREAGS